MTYQQSAASGPRGDHVRVLIYSHDSFGLGHLRRCREIAHTFVHGDADVSVLIVSGSSVIGSFEFCDRVDFVRVPGVTKLPDGAYVSQGLPLAIEDTIALRAAIIRETVECYRPDLVIVDKEPLGLCDELRSTLEVLRARGVPCVLGVRDVMDDPVALAREWESKNAARALTQFYDEIWVYGLRDIWDPLSSIPLSREVRQRMVYTGYLLRSVAADSQPPPLRKISEPYLLVTIGGGGDGEEVVDWVLRAYEANADLPHPAVVTLGPFMHPQKRAEFHERAARLSNVETLTFAANMEGLIAGATGIVSMCGYNTICEILSFDKPALVVPRTAPRREQFIRAKRTEELQLTRMLAGDGPREAGMMAAALRALPDQPRPSAALGNGLADGRDNLMVLARRWIQHCRSDDGLSMAEWYDGAPPHLIATS